MHFTPTQSALGSNSNVGGTLGAGLSSSIDFSDSSVGLLASSRLASGSEAGLSALRLMNQIPNMTLAHRAKLKTTEEG